MFKYFVLNLLLGLLVWQVVCDEPTDNPLEDEDYDFDNLDVNDTDIYLVAQPQLLQVRARQKSYSLNFVRVNWHTALEICALQNQVLASVSSMEENEALVSAMQNYGVYNSDETFWLGGSQLGHIGHWSWLSTGQPIRNINWSNYEKWDSYWNDNCLEISSRGQWNSNDCDLQRPFVCEDHPACA